MKRHYFVITAALLLFAACQKEPVPGSEPTPKSPITLTAEEAVRLPLLSDSYTVSHKEAEGYARSLAAALIRNGTTTKGVSLLGTAGVVDSILAPAVTTKADAPQGKVYVVDLGNGKGYVLTPGDSRIPEKILGYSDEGSFADTKDNPSFNYAMECLTAYVAAETERIEGMRGDSVYLVLCEKLGLDGNGGATKGWAEDHNGEFTNIRVEPVGETWTDLGPRLGPLLSSRWSQNHPFNWVLRERTGQDYPVGCVATAVAQIMYYHKRGTFKGHTYQWANFKSYGVDTDDALMDLGQLFVDLGLPENLNMRYTTTESTAFSTNVPRTFSAFGYTSNNVAGVSDDAINSSVSDGRPVYASGSNKLGKGGHAWVIDGSEGWHTYQNYKLYYYNMFGEIIHEETEVREEGYPVYGVHCNWGWGGSGDCWVSTRAFKPGGGYQDMDFSNGNQMIYSIRPR